MVIIQEAVSYFHLTGLSTSIDIYRFDSENNGKNVIVASGCLQQNLLNLTRHVIVVFAYDVQSRLMVGPAVILQNKKHMHGSTNVEGKIMYI